MKKLTLVGLFVGTLAVGAIVGALGQVLGGRRAILGRMAFAKPEIDLALHAAQEAEWAARLRLNDAKSTIADLENSINIQVSTIAGWDDVAPPDEQTRKARDRFLTSVKVYQESYPASRIRRNGRMHENS